MFNNKKHLATSQSVRKPVDSSNDNVYKLLFDLNPKTWTFIFVHLMARAVPLKNQYYSNYNKLAIQRYDIRLFNLRNISKDLKDILHVLKGTINYSHDFLMSTFHVFMHFFLHKASFYDDKINPKKPSVRTPLEFEVGLLGLR